MTWALIALLIAQPVFAGVRDLTHQGMRDIVKISRAIALVQPRLEEHKYLEYAVGIYRAARKYGIEPSVIIAITQQETGFRENLPEGPAGERGICQILKSWLKSPKFKAEFKTFAINDFSKPAKAFMVSAWILRDLKNRITTGTLPYWSFYNAKQFHNRFKYFLAVNKFVAIMKKHEHQLTDRAVAALDGESDEHDIAFAKPAPEPQMETTTSLAAGEPTEALAATTASVGAPETARKIFSQMVQSVRSVVARPEPAAPPTTAPVSQRVATTAKPAPTGEAQARLTQAAVAPRETSDGKTYWIPDAFRKIQRQGRFVSNTGTQKVISPAIMRAAAELDVGNAYFNSGPIQD